MAATAGEALATGAGVLTGLAEADGDAGPGTSVTLDTGAGAAEADPLETTLGVVAGAGAGLFPGLAIA